MLERHTFLQVSILCLISPRFLPALVSVSALYLSLAWLCCSEKQNVSHYRLGVAST